MKTPAQFFSRRFDLALGVLLLVPISVLVGAVPAVQIGFEAPDFSPGSVDGQRGWVVELGKADIVGGPAHEGEQCLRLVASAPFSQARLRLDDASTTGSVNFIDFWVRPVASKVDPMGEMLEIDGARIGFFLSEDAPGRGIFWVFDAKGEDNGEWIKTPVGVRVDSNTGESPEWVRVTLREDFIRQTWDCWIGGTMTAANLGFQEPHVAFTENYIIMGDAVQNVFLDDLMITASNPFGRDTDSDGVPDDVEKKLGTQVYFDDRDEDADGDGTSNLAEFIASGLNQTPIIGEGSLPLPDAPKFSRLAGLVDEAFDLEVSGGVDGSSLRYTTDGSDPRRNPQHSLRYDGPITIATTTVIRAVQVDSAGRVSPAATAAWVFPDSVVDQKPPEGVPSVLQDLGRGASVYGSYSLPFEMRTRSEAEPWPDAHAVSAALRAAPVVVIATDPTALFGEPDGIYHAPGSTARDGKVDAALTAFGFEGESVISAPEVNLSVSGDSSRYHDVTIKHSFRVRLPDAAPLPLAGLLGTNVAPARQLVLRHPTQDSWTVGAQWAGQRKYAHYFNDQLAAESLRSLGHPALARRWVHLFLNQTYWGAYELIEQLGKSDQVTALVEADETGRTRAIFGSAAGWSELIGSARALATQASQRRVDEAEWASIRARVDESGLIDYLLVNVWMANSDWPLRNYLIAEGTNRFSFLPWDAELSLGVEAKMIESSAEGLFQTGSGPAGLFSALCASAEFRAVVRERLLELRDDDGQLAAASWTNQFAKAGTVERLLPAEAARWGCWLDASLNHAEAWEAEQVRLASEWIPSRSVVIADAFERQLTEWDRRDARLTDALAHQRPPEPVVPFAFMTAEGPLDTDGDGLPDAWEVTHGFNPNDSADGTSDADGDGLVASIEFLLKTDPNVATQRPILDPQTLVFGRPDRPVVRRGQLLDDEAAETMGFQFLPGIQPPVDEQSGK